MDVKPMYSNAFAPSGRTSSLHHTQGVALGYVLVAPSLTLQLFSEPIGELINIYQFFPTFVVRRKD